MPEHGPAIIVSRLGAAAISPRRRFVVWTYGPGDESSEWRQFSELLLAPVAPVQWSATSEALVCLPGHSKPLVKAHFRDLVQFRRFHGFVTGGICIKREIHV